MAWLLRDDHVLAALELARHRSDLAAERDDGFAGAYLVRPARSMHTLGLRGSIDVAYCTVAGDSLVVLRTTSMRPWRLGRPSLRARCVISAPAGAFARWELRVGDCLEIRE